MLVLKGRSVRDNSSTSGWPLDSVCGILTRLTFVSTYPVATIGQE